MLNLFLGAKVVWDYLKDVVNNITVLLSWEVQQTGNNQHLKGTTV